MPSVFSIFQSWNLKTWKVENFCAPSCVRALRKIFVVRDSIDLLAFYSWRQVFGNADNRSEGLRLQWNQSSAMPRERLLLGGAGWCPMVLLSIIITTSNQAKSNNIWLNTIIYGILCLGRNYVICRSIRCQIATFSSAELKTLTNIEQKLTQEIFNKVLTESNQKHI